MGRPLADVRHGTHACARRGCDRSECLEALRKYRNENYADNRNGIHALISSSEAAEHARKLLRADMPPKDIARLAGVDDAVIVRIVWGNQKRIHWIIADAILGVPVPEFGWNSSTDGFVDSVGASRRLQALALQGFGIRALVRATELNRGTIRQVRAQERPRILISRARKIKEAHDLLWDEDPANFGLESGEATRTRLYAEKQGWLPTEAWADIDDPDCKPSLATPRYAVLTENARELINQQGYTMAHAAERLGVDTETLGRAIRYHAAKAS